MTSGSTLSRSGVALGGVVAVVLAGVGAAGAAGAKPAPSHGHRLAGHIPAPTQRIGHTKVTPHHALPSGLPHHGSYAFLLRLKTQSSAAAYRQASSGRRATPAAAHAAHAQLSRIASAQRAAIASLPRNTHVLYKTHEAMAGVAVMADVSSYRRLFSVHGVRTVYPIVPKTPSLSYAVPFQRIAQAWNDQANRGGGRTIAIIDSGVDYTHADLGGVGTPEDYDAAFAQGGQPVSPNEFPGPKVAAGYDLAGDDYNADPQDPNFNPVPTPDPYPLDCLEHGTHVAGIAAGYGENANGTTYTGAYNNSTPFNSMKIGPGVAPKATLYAYRVFGCEGSSDLIGDAIDMAIDPNGDGDPSDHVDVINMSLGADFGSPRDGDSVLTNQASKIGVTMAVASGNAGDRYDIGGSPGNATRSIAVANSEDASAVVDSVTVTAPVSIAGDYDATRSVLYDYTTDPDLSGNLARVSDPSNLDACDPLSVADAAAVLGKVAFVEWTDNDATRRCGSLQRADNLTACGCDRFRLRR